jgi:class 3 adenylate cyclase/tetratricopeptide (TPR) repeat protein
MRARRGPDRGEAVSQSTTTLRAVELAWLDQTGGERRYVESETRIGRGEQNNVRLTDPSVSRDHALIHRSDGSFLISDLGSANGTFVNDERIHLPRSLSPGDRVKFASVEFTFNLDLAQVSPDVTSDPRLASSVSQFLTLSGDMDVKSYVEGDLRVVTVLFLDLCGFTTLSATMSPEQVTLVMNQCFQHLTRTAAHFGGYVDKYMGDAMMVLFGAPHGHEDDPERAVRAAIAMQDVLTHFSERLQRRSGIALQMRVGVNTGEVLAGRVGSGEFSAFTVMGDVVNVAQRFEVAARVGHILVGESAYHLTRRVVSYTALPPMQVRGKTELTNTYEVVGLRADDPSAEPDWDAPFIGRESELRVLAEVLAQRGGLRSASIVGEPSAGKSRLLFEFCKLHGQALECVHIRCLAYEQQTPYAVVREMARVILDRLDLADSTFPAWAELVGEEEPTLEAGLELDSMRGKLADLLVDLVRRLSPQKSVLLALDSAEWLDAGSRAVLELALDSLRTADVMLVTASRSPAGDDWPPNVTLVPLQVLSRDESRQLVLALVEGRPVEPGSIERLADWSGGSPLVIEGIVESAFDAGNAPPVDGHPRTVGGENVGGAYRLRSAVQASLDSLSAAERQVLRLATLVGQPWTATLVVDALEAPLSVHEALSHLVSLGFLVQLAGPSEPSYAFRHEITRAVILASLPQSEGRRLHNRVALALEGRYDPVRPDPIGLKQISDHFASAGQAWRAVEYLLRSADLAAAGLTVEGAVAQYRTIVREASALTEADERTRLEVEIHERIGDLLLRDANLAEAQIAFELAAERSVSAQRRAELQIKLGITAVRRGNPQRVLEVVDPVADLADLSLATYASAHALAALALAAQGNVRAGLERAQRAHDQASAAVDQGTLGLACFALGRVHYLAGNLTAAADALRRSAEVRQAAGERLAWAESQVTLGLVQCAIGELRQAEESVRSALTPPDHSERGADDDSQATDALGRGAESLDRWNLACAAIVLGRLLVDRGEGSRGERHLSGALRASQQTGARELAIEARLEIADYHLTTGWNPRTGRSSLASDAVDQTIVDLRTLLDEAQALQLGALACRARSALSVAFFKRAGSNNAHDSDARESFALAREALVVADRVGLELYGAVAQRAVGSALTRLGYWSQGAAQFDESASKLERLGARVELTRTLIAAAGAEYTHASPPRIVEVRAKLTRAWQLANELGLEGDRAAAEAGLQATLAG